MYVVWFLRKVLSCKSTVRTWYQTATHHWFVLDKSTHTSRSRVLSTWCSSRTQFLMFLPKYHLCFFYVCVLSFGSLIYITRKSLDHATFKYTRIKCVWCLNTNARTTSTSTDNIECLTSFDLVTPAGGRHQHFGMRSALAVVTTWTVVLVSFRRPENMNEDPMGLRERERESTSKLWFSETSRSRSPRRGEGYRWLTISITTCFSTGTRRGCWRRYSELSGFEDDSLTGPERNGNHGLNDVIKNALNGDNKIKIDVNTTLISNLTNVVTGEAAHVFSDHHWNSEDLDTFTKFDPIRPKNHTRNSHLQVPNLTVTMNFMIGNLTW